MISRPSSLLLVFLVHGVLYLADFVEIFLGQWLVLLVLEAYLVLLLRDLILDGQLVVLLASAFDLWSDHEDVVERDDHRVVIVKLLGLLDLLGEQVGVLLDHFVDHVLYHTEVHHDVVLGQAVGLLKLFELATCVVVDEREYLLDVDLDLIDLLNGRLVLHNVLLVLALALMDLLLEFFLLLLPLVVFTESLVAVPLNLFLHLGDVLVELLVLLGELVHVFAQREVPFLGLDEVADQLVNTLCSSRFQDLLE